MVSLQKFSNLIELITYFKDDKTCRQYLEYIRWQDKLVCPYADCKHDHINRYTDVKRYKCAKCQRQYSVKVEVKRFDKMLNSITTTLPYNKLIQNEKRTEFNPATDFANAYKWLEAKQGTIEFPNEDARRDV